MSRRRELSTPVQWAIIIGLAIAAVAVALGLLAVVRVGVVVAWAVFS